MRCAFIKPSYKMTLKTNINSSYNLYFGDTIKFKTILVIFTKGQ